MLNRRFSFQSLLAGCMALAAVSADAQQSCKLVGQGRVGPARQPVAVRHLDVSDLDVRYDRVLVYKAPLPVLADGAPDALHADVLDGSASLQRLCDVVAGHRLDPVHGGRQRALSCQETEEAFAQFKRDAWKLPPQVELVWRHGLTEKITPDGQLVPCVRSEGPYAGFLGSRTVLKNGLGAEAGECAADDQVNAREVPGIAIPAGANVIRAAGARLGDLAFVINTRTHRASPAVVMDAGPASVSALGSVALNSRLTGIDADARRMKTRRDVAQLNIDTPDVVVAVFPGTAGFKLQRPYMAENVTARLDALLGSMGHASQASFTALLESCRTAPNGK